MLFLVVVLTMTSAAAAVVWSVVQKRDKERELLFVGHQFKVALERYRRHGAAPSQDYPRALEQLVRDPRSVNVVRHLRKVYADPFTGKEEWGLVRDSRGGIVGVYSLAPGVPLKAANFPYGLSVAGQRSYAEWVFMADGARPALPDQRATAPGAPASAAAPQ